MKKGGTIEERENDTVLEMQETQIEKISRKTDLRLRIANYERVLHLVDLCFSTARKRDLTRRSHKRPQLG